MSRYATMRADRADQFQSTTYGKVLSGSRIDMVPSVLLVEIEDQPSPAIPWRADRNL